MTYNQLIEKYVDESSEEQMRLLSKETSSFIECMRENHPEKVNEFLTKIDLILNPHFSKETAKYAVSKMKNKDGSVGEHWTYETTTKVLEGKGYKFKPCDWYYVLNMVYSDYYKSGRADETYIEMAHDFLCDEDAPENKAKRYFIAMHF